MTPIIVFYLCSFLSIFGYAIINRIRGGEDFGILDFLHNFPKSTYWIWVFVFPLAYIYGFSWPESLTLAIGSLIWALPPWSRWASLYHKTPAYGEGRSVNWFENIIDTISFNNSYLALFNRHIICLVPVVCAMFYFVGIYALFLFLIAPGAVLSYTVGWLVQDKTLKQLAFPIGEYVTGAVAGISLTLIHYFYLGFHTFFS